MIVTYSFFFLMIRRPPRSTLFPTRRSSDLTPIDDLVAPGERALVAEHEQLAFRGEEDRKSTRLNSSHVSISYAVFCLKKKNHQSVRKYDDVSRPTLRQQGVTIGSARRACMI